MKTIKGDLIQLATQGHFDIIVHGCNCKCKMGAGVARQIKKVFPAAYHADINFGLKDKQRLGHISIATINGQNNTFYLVNAYTQYNYSLTGPCIDYDALRACFKKIKTIATGKKVAYPKIGAGLAGGDWQKIRTIINQELEGIDHTLVEYKS